MTPDELAKLKAALAAAGDHLVDAVSQVEQAEVEPDSTAHAPHYDVFVSYSAPKSSVTLSLPLGLIYIGDIGKTTLTAQFLWHEAVAGDVLWHDEALVDYLEHAIIGHLANGDAVALAKLDAAFPTSDDSTIEVPALERVDAAVYPDTILACNGRSLDSHNPWHLELSFEDYLAAERPDPVRPGSPANPGLSHPPHLVIENKEEIQEEEAVSADDTQTWSPNKGAPVEASRNKVAPMFIDTSGHAAATRRGRFVPALVHVDTGNT